MKFSKDILKIDPRMETDRLVNALRYTVQKQMRRQGAVVGISGGVDSAVVLALCVHAFGPEQVTALIMPDRDSEPQSEALARELARTFQVAPLLENITPALEALGCYCRRDEAIRRVFPDYDPASGYKAKIVLPQNLLENGSLNLYSLTVIDPEGHARNKALPTPVYLQIVAASNLKQRLRMTTLYYHAELRQRAVVGTPNKNEHDQGFFVKYGDGGIDLAPIGHLYKTQVYQLAEFLGVPASIRNRIPTTDTYSAPASQQEFFFRLPFEIMDVLWHAQEIHAPLPEVAEAMGLTEQQVRNAWADFDRKRKATDYLRMPPSFFSPKLFDSNSEERTIESLPIMMK